SFNLDEYYPVSPENPQSYRYFMETHLFSLVNIPRENIHIPNGLAEDPEKECEEYDKALKRAGYPDLQLLGIGRNGHIGFNEPGAFLLCNTHQTRLAPSTVDANARFFSSASDVPQTALTMGVGGIMKSKTVILIAVGKEKKEAVSALMKNRITPDIPATLLLAHPDFHLFCDKDAYPSENNN
ncbi:MAG: glucosamine-6-phosphate deaminase, partial [Clostridia bacterium]|nr:glucosamine-6-phosphate deaminase [Clostridia bacterium]